MTNGKFVFVRQFLLSFLHFYSAGAATLPGEDQCTQTCKNVQKHYFFRAEVNQQIIAEKQGITLSQNKLFF